MLYYPLNLNSKEVKVNLMVFTPLTLIQRDIVIFLASLNHFCITFKYDRMHQFFLFFNKWLAVFDSLQGHLCAI